MTGSSVLLDTNAVIMVQADRGEKLGLDQYARQYLPVVALGELYFGAENSGNPAKNLSTLKRLLDSVEVLPAGEETAAVYGKLRLHLNQAGRPIPANDLWIAAIAVEHGLPLLTRDAHFRHVPELRILTW